MIEVARPGGDMYRPAPPEFVLYQDLRGGRRTRGDTGGGHFDVTSEKGNLYLEAPNFANKINVSTHHQLRSLSFPTAHWESVLDEAADGGCSVESLQLYRGPFRSPTIQSALRSLWAFRYAAGWRHRRR